MRFKGELASEYGISLYTRATHTSARFSRARKRPDDLCDGVVAQNTPPEKGKLA
jgi:hypothetical protein